MGDAAAAARSVNLSGMNNGEIKKKLGEPVDMQEDDCSCTS
jgi:hypothetical protein